MAQQCQVCRKEIPDGSVECPHCSTSSANNPLEVVGLQGYWKTILSIGLILFITGLVTFLVHNGIKPRWAALGFFVAFFGFMALFLECDCVWHAKE